MAPPPVKVDKVAAMLAPSFRRWPRCCCAAVRDLTATPRDVTPMPTSLSGVFGHVQAAVVDRHDDRPEAGFLQVDPCLLGQAGKALHRHHRRARIAVWRPSPARVITRRSRMLSAPGSNQVIRDGLS